jgi:Protein of unknown function (DUF3025)
MALTHRVGWDADFCARNPWFWPLAGAARAFREHHDWPLLEDFDALYARQTQAAVGCEPLRFCANVRKQDKREAGRVVLSALYDARITLGAEVPTRERDWHDLLNALCFATFPRSKRALHARQYRVLAARIEPDATRLPGARTKEQDALTLFDEGGVVLAAEPDAAQALLATTGSERAALFLQLSAARKTRLVPFGHALFEHLVEGLRCPGGCTQVVAVSELWADERGLLEQVDVALAHMLDDASRFVSPRDCSHVRLDTLELARMF